MRFYQDTEDCALESDLCDFLTKLNGEVPVKRRATIPISSLIPALLNKSVSYPENVYDEYTLEEGFDERTDIHYDIIMLPSGLLGIEFIKSHVFYTPCSSKNERFATIIECIQGVTTVIMQKNLSAEECEFQDQPMVQEGLIVNVGAGEKLAIPEGYFFTFVNTTDQPTVFARVYKSYNLVDYNEFKKIRGMAYYCIRKNAREEVVYNPFYRNTPPIKRSTPSENHIPNLDIDPHKSLLQTLKAKTEMFMNILV